MTVQDKNQIFSRLREHKAEIRQFGVKRFGLFGSFLRGQQTVQSDVDLLVEFESGQKSFDNFMRLGFFLEDLLERKVDLITPESLSPHIGPKILREVEYGFINS
ncbi:MAG: nucleotidyltransferase family protein [Pyrinomonadaceae bacterium]